MNFVDYRNQLLQRREGEIALWQLVRNFSQWFFDLLRNFVLKSGSEVLFYLHQFALGVIFLYCLSYADQWYVNLFGFLANRRVAHRTVNITIAVMLFLVIRWGASLIVVEISHAQL